MSDPDATPAPPRQHRIIRDLGRLYHAQISLAEWAGLAGFTKQIAVWRVFPELCRDESVSNLLISDINEAARLANGPLTQILNVWRGASGIEIAVEHVSGLSLADLNLMAREQGELLPLPLVLAVLLDVARVLDRLHGEQSASGAITHGDLRPEQILLSFDGTVKLTGLGFGRFLQAASPDGQWCVFSGRCYQPPDRLERAPRQRAAPGVDCFSLGAILLESATGHLLYGGGHEQRLLAALHEPAEPIQDALPPLPGQLADVIARACALNPGERFTEMEQLSSALHSSLFELGCTRPGRELIREGLEGVKARRARRPDDSQRALASRGAARAGAAVTAPTQSRRATAGTFTGPLIGQQSVLERIGRSLEAAGQGQGQALLVTGEQGIGRSRLLAEVGQRLSSSQGQVAWLRVQPREDEHTVGHAAILRLLASAIGLDPACELADLAAQSERLRAFGLEPRLIAAVCGLLGEGAPPEPARVAGHLSQATIRCIAGLSWESTTLVTWDDLHWTDAASFDLLGELLDQIALLPVVFLLAAPASFEPRWSVPAPPRVQLPPLSREECYHLLLSTEDRARRIAPALLDLLVDRSSGNPSLLQEELDLLTEARRVEVVDGCLALCGDDSQPLPELGAAVRLRLQGLSRGAASVANAAALAGPTLDEHLLTAATGQSPEVVQCALADLVQLRMLRRDSRGLSFGHQRLKQAVLDQIPAAELSPLRRRVASAIIEGADEPGLVDHAASLLAEAGDLVMAAREISRAAARQQRRGDLQGAASRYDRALQWFHESGGATPRMELELCVETGACALHCLDLELGERALRRAVELADRSDDARVGAQARVLLCRVHARQGRLDEAVARAREAIPMAERSEDQLILAQAYAAVGESYQQWGEYGPDLEYITTALRIAGEAGDLARVGEYLQLAVMHAGGVGEYDRTLEDLARAHAIADAEEDPVLTCQLLKAEGLLQFFMGQPEVALATNLKGGARARDHGLAEVEIVMLHNAGDNHLLMGNMSEALFYFNESLRRSRATRFDRLTEANEMFIGFIEAAHLGAETGFERLRAAVESGRQLGRIWNVTQGCQLLGRALLQQGNPAEALVHLEESVRLAEKSGVKYFIDEARGWLERAREGAAR